MYFHALNFLRFILAVGVILFHYGVNYYPFNTGILHKIIVNSSFRVSFFFFISGFVMCIVYGRQALHLTAKHFYKRRFARIFPVYWLAFVITLLVVMFIKNAAPKGLNIILHGIGLQSLNPGHVLDLNYPTWSISVEIIFYLLFPFLLKRIVKLNVKSVVWVSIFVWLLQSLQHIIFVEYVYNGTKISEEFISTFPLWHLSTFFAGMATARWIEASEPGNFFSKYALLLLVISVLIFFCIILIPNPFIKYVHNGLLSPLFALVIIGLYYDNSYLNRTLSHRRVSSLGDFSYGLFIFQYPVWVLCTGFSGDLVIRSGWFFLVYIIILFAVAKLTHIYFEKPFLKKLRG